MSRYIPPSQRPKSPHKTCQKSQPKTYPKIKRNTYKSTSQKSHFRRLKSKALTDLNNEIKENLKYNQYLNEKLFGPTFKLSPPKEIPTKNNCIDNESKNIKIHFEAIPTPATVPNGENNIDNNSNDIPANSYPNTTINPQKIGENNKIKRGKHNMGKILSTSKLHFKIAYGKSGDKILACAATSKAISNKNDEKKTSVTISISTTSKTLPYDPNKNNDTDQNISHQIDEKLNVKYATLLPKDYAQLRAYTHIINTPIATPMIIIDTATPGTLLLHSNEKSGKNLTEILTKKLINLNQNQTSTLNQLISNITPTTSDPTTAVPTPSNQTTAIPTPSDPTTTVPASSIPTTAIPNGKENEILPIQIRTDRSKDPIKTPHTPQIPNATFVHEKLNGTIHINKNESKKIEDAIMRALTHILLGILLSSLINIGPILTNPNETLPFNQSLSGIKPTLTPNKYILNGKNKNILTSTLLLLGVFIQYITIYK